MANELKTLTADDFFALPDLTKAPRVEPVPVPELGGTVYVRELSSAERDALEASLATDDNKAPVNPRAKWVAATCCDAAGKLLFIPTQVVALGARSAVVVQRIFQATRKLNPVVGDAVEAEKKGSESGPSGGSPSASA
jgi:hypothetical protein